MLRVGVPEAIDPELRNLLPRGISLEVIPMTPERSYDIEFWIAPPWPKQAAQAWPWLRGVRVVQSTIAGIDGLLRLLPRDVVLCDARGVHNIATAEWTVGVILAALKYLPFYGAIQRSGVWKRRFEAQPYYNALHGTEKRPYPEIMVEELHGKRVLIVGYGAIGQAIEARLEPFGVQFDRIARSARDGIFGAEALRDLLPLADVVVLIVPSTTETTGMMGAEELGLMKRGALLVNAARGSVVDTEALIGALEDGRIRAAVDVTDPEPLPEGHPLWNAPNLILTPHVAGSSPMFMVRAMQFAADQIGRYLQRRPLENVVQGEY